MTDRSGRGTARGAFTRRTLAARFRRLYGESPSHLLYLLASFAVCGYAAARLLERDWFAVAKWVVLGALVHDLVLVPLYAGTDWVLHKALGAPRPAAAPAAGTPHEPPAEPSAGTPDAPAAPGDSGAPADSAGPAAPAGPGPSGASRAPVAPAAPAAPAARTRLDRRVAAVNHLRVPAFLSLLLLLVYWPLITEDPRNYQLDTALTPGVFMDRWLLVTAALFGVSALWFCLRLWRERRPARPPRGRTTRPVRRPG